MSRIVLGIDPGFAELGFALVRLEEHGEIVESVGLVETEKSSKKQHVLASDDNARRGREVARELHKLLLLDGRPGDHVVAICAESMSFPRNSSAAAKMAISWGVIVTLSELHGVPLIQASPQEIKFAVCGSKSASKEEVQRALDSRYNGRPAECAVSIVKSKIEHPYDALAAVVACLDSEVLRMARRLQCEASTKL